MALHLGCRRWWCKEDKVMVELAVEEVLSAGAEDVDVRVVRAMLRHRLRQRLHRVVMLLDNGHGMLL